MMGFRLVAPAALLLAVLAVPILLMYILKLRRRDRLVSSTLLWRQVVEDLQANAPWQRFQRNLLMILQLLVLGALVLALSGPTYTRAYSYSGQVVILIDQSYVMAAHDVRPSRFAVAQHEARSLVSRLSGRALVSVIGMGREPQLVVAHSHDAATIDRAIQSLMLETSSSANVPAALSLASSIVRYQNGIGITVFTSRESGFGALPKRLPYSLKVVRIGAHLEDLGISTFQAKRVRRQVQAVVRVHNFGLHNASSNLELFANGHLADVRPLSVKAGRDRPMRWLHLPLSTRRLEAHLSRRDDLNEDKTAWAVLPTRLPAKAFLVSKGDPFLQTALTMNQAVALSPMHQADYTSAAAKHFDVAVFDGVLPNKVPPVDTLLLNPPPGRMRPIGFGGTITSTGLGLSKSSGHSPLLRYVNTSDIHVARIRQLSSRELAPVATVHGHPAISVGQVGRVRIVSVNFNLEQSDWPLRVSFPIFVANAIDYLNPPLVANPSNLVTGRPLDFSLPASARGLEVIQPNGSSTKLGGQASSFSGTQEAGIYTLRTLGTPRMRIQSVAVNFFPPRFASASGRQILQLGHARKVAPRGSHDTINLSWVFVTLAVALLGLEWWIGFRD